jgi:hypothetical protein
MDNLQQTTQEVLFGVRPAQQNRCSPISAAASSLLEEELETIKEALLHPPKSVDWPSAAASGLSAIYFGLNLLIDSEWHLEGRGILGVTLAAIICVLAVWRVVVQLSDKQTLNKLALRFVQRRMDDLEKQRREPPTASIL